MTTNRSHGEIQPRYLTAALAAALDADVHLTAGHDLGCVRFEPHAA